MAPIERGSTTHGPHVDEHLQHEVQGRVQGQQSPRAEEWHEAESAGEDQPAPDQIPDRGHTEPGTPSGMTSQDVAGRSQLARYLPYKVFPADRDGLASAAEQNQAPEDILTELARLPDSTTYRTVTEVWVALGHGREDDSHRA